MESGSLKGKGVELIVMDDKVIGVSSQEQQQEGGGEGVLEALFKSSDGSAR